MGFETAKSAIFTNQKALDIVGNNLSNIDTNGYTRQRVDISAIAQSAWSSRVASPGARIGLTGQGVEALGVSQMRDSFLDKRFRDEYSKTSYHSQAANILSDIQSVMDGGDLTSESSMLSAIQGVYESINSFMQDDVTSDTAANIVLTAFRSLTQVFQQFDAKLDNVAQQHIYDMSVTVDRTNEIFQQIAHLNAMIAQDATVVTDPDNEYFRPNELLDERNLLLDELAAYGNISFTERSDGTVDVEMNGHRVVSGSEYTRMSMRENADDTVSLVWTETGENVTLTGGTLLASIEYINGRGNNVQSPNETPNKGIPYYRDRLDAMANALADIANHAIPEVGEDGKPKTDANGNIIYKTLLAAKMDNGKTNSKTSVTAGNISISDEWTNGGAGYFIYSKDDRTNVYAQNLMYALTEKDYSFRSYGESFSGTFEEYYVDMVSTLGGEIGFQNGRQESTGKVADDFLDRRDQISGVSRDEETANMLQYQKSYEAAARLMTTLDEILDVLINRMGRVGL